MLYRYVQACNILAIYGEHTAIDDGSFANVVYTVAPEHGATRGEGCGKERALFVFDFLNEKGCPRIKNRILPILYIQISGLVALFMHIPTIDRRSLNIL